MWKKKKRKPPHKIMSSPKLNSRNKRIRNRHSFWILFHNEFIYSKSRDYTYRYVIYTSTTTETKRFLVLRPIAGSYSNIPFFQKKNPAQFIWRHSLVSNISSGTINGRVLKVKETGQPIDLTLRVVFTLVNSVCARQVYTCFLFFFGRFMTRNLIPYEQSLFK